jgi:DNA-binding CsgD family transcriptional regulator
VVINGEASALRGRRREQEALDHLLRDVRGGKSRVLVLRGEAGVGKTALLDYLIDSATAGRVTRTAGVEPETEIAYSGLQQLCAPLMSYLDRLPAPQRSALATGLGLSAGDPPDMLLVGLAVLGLFAEAADEKPLICVIDDVQWLDRMSEVVLTFVARRLDCESVALVFAARSPDDEHILVGSPELRVSGLAYADARALLESVLTGPIDPQVRDRIVAETRGNPLALLELPRGLSPAELAFGFGGQVATPPSGWVEEGFRRRIGALPDDTRLLLLAAAVEPVGDVLLLLRALEKLGVGVGAAAPAVAAGLLEIGSRLRFRHPLVRSAAWRTADPGRLRAVHQALAEVTDPQQDPDRRAWHRAHSALGPDEEIAAELERSAERALARGGQAAAAAFLRRAAELTPEAKPRASRTLAAAAAHLRAGAVADVPDLLAAAELGPLDPLQRAEMERLLAQVTFAIHPGRAAGPPLLAAARRLVDLDPAAARETYLSALVAAVHAGGVSDRQLVAEASREMSADDDTAGLFLTGLATWCLDGYARAVPKLTRALTAITADVDLNLLRLAVPVAHEIFDDVAWHVLTERAVTQARRSGALSVLPSALSFRAGALLHAGRFADASELIDETQSLAAATGLPPDPSGQLNLLALRGQEREALDLIATTVRDAQHRDEGRVINMAHHVRAVLYNGLGRYPEAMEAAHTASGNADLGFYHWALMELVEAAARSGEAVVAAEARDRLAEQTVVAGTDWARGTQALADALAGPHADTEKRFRAAIDLLPPIRLGLQVARARLLYGEWLRREGRRTDARVQLRGAYDAFATMGAEGFAERARRELIPMGEIVRKRTVGFPEDMTPQETQIAQLAAAGRTNPEIGAVLFLSPRTIEWHLRKVFAKLGVSSRRELAAALTDR